MFCIRSGLGGLGEVFVLIVGFMGQSDTPITEYNFKGARAFLNAEVLQRKPSSQRTSTLNQVDLRLLPIECQKYFPAVVDLSVRIQKGFQESFPKRFLH